METKFQFSENFIKKVLLKSLAQQNITESESLIDIHNMEIGKDKIVLPLQNLPENFLKITELTLIFENFSLADKMFWVNIKQVGPFQGKLFEILKKVGFAIGTVLQPLLPDHLPNLKMEGEKIGLNLDELFSANEEMGFWFLGDRPIKLIEVNVSDGIEISFE